MSQEQLFTLPTDANPLQPHEQSVITQLISGNDSASASSGNANDSSSGNASGIANVSREDIVTTAHKLASNGMFDQLKFPALVTLLFIMLSIPAVIELIEQAIPYARSTPTSSIITRAAIFLLMAWLVTLRRSF